MRTIQKEISLEGFTSRLPSVIPAYKDNTLYCFDNESLSGRNYEYTSNYGMIPTNVTISGFANGNYRFVIDCNNFQNGDIKTLSFHTVSDWYHFFKEYYHLLKDYGHCKMVYSSATQYYDAESKNPRYANSMVYGGDRGTYEALDETFTERGGKVSASTVTTLSATSIVDICDDGFYKFMSEKLIPTFVIPSEYSSYWNRGELYYPDVIKWMGWLKSRLDYEESGKYTPSTTEGDVERWNCKNEGIDDCCECEEYFKRGGERIYNEMVSWYNNVQNGINELSELVKNNESCFTPTFFQDLTLTTSLDNLGEMSILSEEYELGKDYRGAENLSADTNTRSGTTIVYENGESLILTGSNGFCFDTKYMEKVFKPSDWSSYTEIYVKKHIDEFKTNFQYYAYDEDNKLISGETPSDVSGLFYDYYSITNTDSILINGNLYSVLKAEKGEYNGKSYFVYRDEMTNTPYAIVNGRKIFAEFYPYCDDDTYNNQPYYYFTIFKEVGYDRKKAQRDGDRIDDIDDSFKDKTYFYKHYGRTVEKNDLYHYINYNGSSYDVLPSGLTIDNVDYHRISGYTYDKYGSPYYLTSSEDTSGNAIYNDSFVWFNSDLTIDEKGKLKVRFNYTPTIYNASIITGHTISKLNTLKSPNQLSDDIGNDLNGLYNVNDAYNFQPNEGDRLEPIYQVGNTYLDNKAVYSQTETDPNKISRDTNYFVGDIITEMDFYYRNSDGSKNTDTEVKVELGISGETNMSSLSAITKSTSIKETLESQYKVFEPNIYCDITYYMGATLSRKNGEKYILANVKNSSYFCGVEYKETVQFIETDTKYFFNRPKGNVLDIEKYNVINNPIFSNVTVYELKQFNVDSESKLPLAFFKSEIPLWSSDGTNSYTAKYSGDTTSTMEVYPTFMEEYRLGSASMQKVDSNIFIDRGTNAAFEKHIKLGEVATLEALENYGNGWFKMIEN